MVTHIRSHQSPPGHREGQEACPTCGQPVSHLKFAEINAHLAAQAREQDAEVRRQVAATEAKMAAQAQADQANLRKAAAAELVAARAETKKQVETALAPKLAAGEAAALQLAKMEEEHALELRDQRAALEKEQDKVLNAHKAGTFRETERLRAKVTALQRQLEHKTADDLGEGAEVDVFEALKAAFPGDALRRVKRGEPGADIVHDVVSNGRICGTIVYDSKNRGAWANVYVSKLKADQRANPADHAVLVSSVFPRGASQVAVQDGVVIVNPARLIAIVELLRAHLEQVHKLRLSRQARDEKATQLYAFITSERSSQLFERIGALADAMLELEVKETKAHDKTWSERGHLLKSIQQARGSLELEIERIVGTAAEERLA
jgi:hypothetical protein